MKVFRILIAAGVALANISPASGQILSRGTKAINVLKRADSRAAATQERRFITDLRGRRIRLVGPRFYPDPEKQLMFPGRTGNIEP